MKDISDGFARNFLIPQKLVEPATEQKIGALKAQKEQEIHKHEKEEAALSKLAKRLPSMLLEFTRKTDKSGSTFGSVSQKDIADEINKKAEVNLSPSAIVLEHPLKKIGEHALEINLGHGLKSRVRVRIRSIE